jgi:tellurite resistance-related uncharacterized protein
VSIVSLLSRTDRGAVEFRRSLVLIAIVATVMVAGALWFLSLSDPLTVHMVVATSVGVFLSVMLGCGLFAAAFFSERSGHDQSVTDATVRAAVGPNPTVLPDGAESYARTPEFTEVTLPAKLRGDHDTKPGTWGLIHVAEGALRYRVTDPRREPLEALLTPTSPPGIVEPTILHHVESVGAVRFHVEFFRAG